MKSNVTTGIMSGLLLMTFMAGAQNYSEREMAMLNTGGEKKAQKIIYKTETADNNSIETTETATVDYPTLSYPETAAFSVEKDKAFYHLSWQVLAPENLSYTEVQSSQDGENFTTVGFVTTKGSDYFVPSDKNATNYFRLVQYSLNSQKHTSSIVKIN